MSIFNSNEDKSISFFIFASAEIGGRINLSFSHVVSPIFCLNLQWIGLLLLVYENLVYIVVVEVVDVPNEGRCGHYFRYRVCYQANARQVRLVGFCFLLIAFVAQRVFALANRARSCFRLKGFFWILRSAIVLGFLVSHSGGLRTLTLSVDLFSHADRGGRPTYLPQLDLVLAGLNLKHTGVDVVDVAIVQLLTILNENSAPMWSYEGVVDTGLALAALSKDSL